MASLRVGNDDDSDWVVSNYGTWIKHLSGDLTRVTAEAVTSAVKLLVKHTPLIVAHSSDSAVIIPRVMAKALMEPEQDVCCGYALTDGVKPCNYKANCGNMCKMHTKVQGFAAYLNGNGVTVSATECVGCLQPGDGANLVRCRTCPLAWHRTCLLNWASAAGDDVVARIHSGAEVECTACSYLRPRWRSFLNAPVPGEPPFTVPTPSRLTKHNAQLYAACVHKKVAEYGNEAVSPSAINASDRLPLAPPPTSIKATKAEADLLAQGKLAKGTSSALRDDAIRQFKGTLDDNLDNTGSTPDRQIGNIFSRPPGTDARTPQDYAGLGGTAAREKDGLEPVSALPPPPQPFNLLQQGPLTDSTRDALQDLARRQDALHAEAMARYTALERDLRSSRLGTSSNPQHFPTAPPEATQGKKGVDYDIDDNHRSEPAHPENSNFAQGFDYVGMGTGKNEAKRIARFMHVERLDFVSENLHTPEEKSAKSTVTVNGTEIKTSGGAFGIPDRATYELYVTLLINWLRRLTLQTNSDGVFDPSHSANEYQVAVLQQICVRMIFMLATADFLTYLRVHKAEWGIAWRYKMRLAHAFHREPIGDVGLDTDLRNFALRFGFPSVEHRAHPAMRAIAKKYYEPTTLDDVYASVALGPVAGPRLPAGSSPSTGFQASGEKGKTELESSPCVLCRSLTCGSYLKPQYLCKAPIKVECKTCRTAGYPGLRHARTGPRFTKTCKEHQADVDAKKKDP